MFRLLDRMTWILCIGLAIAIFAIDDDLFFASIVIALVVKFALFSPNYIKSRLEFFQQKILKGELNTELHEQKNQDISPEIIQAEPERLIGEVLAEDELQEEVFEEETIYQASQQYEYTPSEPREPSAIERFFSENLLAKLGGILVFLGVLFLLGLVYSVIGDVAKMCIGLTIGFSLFGAGVWLDTKGYIGESRIVMGIAILINYLVILSGRFLLGGDVSADETVLSVAFTFLFLILNTVFAVAASLLYNSRPLLIFGFVFAYLNPLLLGESSSEPYTLLGYTMIVTFGAMFMSYKRKDEILFPLAFILAAIMFIIAPWSDANGWITKLLCINTLGALSLYCSTGFKKSFQNISEILIAGTFFLIGIMGVLSLASVSATQMIIMGASSLGLMAFCYATMNKGAHLYSIGTLGTILTLSPVIYANGLNEGMSAISFFIIAVFGCMNIGVVLFKSKQLLADNIGNIITGLLSGALFLTYMIYFFGNEFFPGMLQGFAFFGLAIIYCSLAFMIVSKIGIETIKTDERYENTFYTISAIGVSLFSLAVAFVFSENKEIVSIIWLLEANVLFFLTSKTKSLKIATAGLILFAIGMMKFLDFLDFGIFWGRSFSGDYGMLVALALVLLSLICNLVLLFREKIDFLANEFYGVHNIIHIIGMGLIALTTHEILDVSGSWNSLLYFSVIAALLGALYDRVHSKGLKSMHLLVYLALMIIHVFMFGDDLGRDRLDLTASTLIAGVYALPFIYDILSRGAVRSKTLLSIFLGYLFILSTLYVYHIFEITFAVTLYWGVLSFILLGYGISKDILPLRTIGLYLISLTAGKVFLYDIWMSVDDTVSRVVALIVVGILMIVLSTMYTRKYGNTLNSEFNLSNLFPDKEKPSQEKVEEAEKSKIQTDIEAIDIQNITSVKLKFNGDDKPVQIRAENLIKISKLIANTYKKTDFKPAELKGAYDMIEKDYKSALSPVQYKKMKDLVAQFVEKGGSIEFIK